MWERGRELKLCVSAGLKLYSGRVIILERSIALYYFYRSEALLLFTSCNAVHYSDWALIKFRVEDNKRKLFYILEPTKKNYISFLKLMFTILRTTCCCCYEVAWGPSSCLSVNTYLVRTHCYLWAGVLLFEWDFDEPGLPARLFVAPCVCHAMALVKDRHTC